MIRPLATLSRDELARLYGAAVFTADPETTRRRVEEEREARRIEDARRDEEADHGMD